MLKWSFHDKKRTTEILTDFSELNSGIHEKIKLLCLASDIGLDIQHLRRLQHDENSIQLGFNIDATLQLTARDAQAATPSSELDDSWGASLAAAAPIERCFSLLDHRGRKYLQEHRHCESSYDGQLNQRTRARVDELAKLLHQPKELVFCIPRCIGWKYLPTTQSVAFVFELPSADDVQPEPQSLFRVLGSKDARISLGDRFRLALALARCVSQLHMVKWVHESFRSQNILFFPERRPDDHPDGREKPSKRQPSANIDYGKPAVLGFEYSRPEVDFSYGLADNSLDRDVYRHPDRQGTPEKPFSKIHDIYALGKMTLFRLPPSRALTRKCRRGPPRNRPLAAGHHAREEPVQDGAQPVRDQRSARHAGAAAAGRQDGPAVPGYRRQVPERGFWRAGRYEGGS